MGALFGAAFSLFVMVAGTLGTIALAGGFVWFVLKVAQFATERAKRRRAVWESFAADHGLTPERGGKKMRGRRHNCTVVLQTVRDANNENVRTELSFDGLPRDLTLSRRNLSILMGLTGVDVYVGDDDFDKRLRVRGSPDRILATLDYDTRLTLIDRVWRHRRAISLRDGKLSIRIPGVPADRAKLDMMWEAVDDLVPVLMGPPEIVPALIERARHDPVPAVRAKALSQLSGHATAESQQVLRAALEDPDAIVRLEAAVLLDNGEALARLLDRDELEGAHELRALRALSHTEHWSTALVHTVPHVVAGLSTDVWDDKTQDDNVALGRLLAAKLAASPPDLAEPVLIGMLDLPSHKVRLAVVRALGKVGSTHSTGRLHEMAENGSTFSQLTGAARQSLAAILAREQRGGSVAGAVTLLEPDEEGALSLAEEPLSAERRVGERTSSRQES